MVVFLSLEAEEQLSNLLYYLENVWGERIMFNFIDKFEQALEVISKMPHAYPESDRIPGLHRCVVTRQVSIYYYINAKKIEIVSILDNRQDIPA
jgi:plasmid stabilization system protein ParE